MSLNILLWGVETAASKFVCFLALSVVVQPQQEASKSPLLSFWANYGLELTVHSLEQDIWDMERCSLVQECQTITPLINIINTKTR